VKQFLANKNITVLEHPPYSPDLAPCNFYLFPKIKSVLKGTHFVSIQNVKEKQVEILNSLTEDDLRNLKIGSIVYSCVSTQKGTILKAIVVDFLNLLKRKSYRHSLVFFVSDHIFVT
jgi:transposase